MSDAYRLKAARPKPRILIASFVPADPRTGMGRWADQMAKALRTNGSEVTLCSSDDFPRIACLGRLAVLVFPVALAAHLVRLRRRFDAAVIHEPSGFWYGVLRNLFHSLPPMVAMCHNVETKCYRELLDAAARAFSRAAPLTRVKAPLFRLWQSQGTIRLADHVICLSTRDWQYIVDILGRSSATVTRLLNGVD